jgi:hypothetical protein
MVSLLPMRRHLCHHGNDVVALVTMASLPLPMHRRLAIVYDDGDGVTGNSINDNCDSATNINNDGNDATDDDIDNNDCNGPGFGIRSSTMSLTALLF